MRDFGYEIDDTNRAGLGTGERRGTETKFNKSTAGERTRGVIGSFKRAQFTLLIVEIRQSYIYIYIYTQEGAVAARKPSGKVEKRLCLLIRKHIKRGARARATYYICIKYRRVELVNVDLIKTSRVIVTTLPDAVSFGIFFAVRHSRASRLPSARVARTRTVAVFRLRVPVTAAVANYARGTGRRP